MEIITDLHIHSHFSIATGRDADLEHLDLWGRYKGLQVVGTGDCTHPKWLGELSGKLEPAAQGLYTLKPELALPLNLQGPRWEAVTPVKFIITGEVSTIYKKNGRVRKVHLLLVLPGLEAARKLSERLGRLGNVTSDGRPILGLDARFVLELVLEIDPQALVIPAHIWTPWFSVLGSKSGFDSLEECFEESTAHIHAVETGLSSDPPMNWRVSGLDRFALVSNSDAHSPQKLAREANIFHVAPTYPNLSLALRTKEGLGGTIEFFPQEGKYHLDGHRQCGLRLSPEESKHLGGLCPQCGRRLTLGVGHRVLDLADRGNGARPLQARPFESLIALPEILGEVLGVGTNSKKVRQAYFRLLEKLGPELEILRHVPLAALAQEGGVLLAHGIDRMRRGEVHIAGGYDGVYGEIRLFTPAERAKLQGQTAFFRTQNLIPNCGDSSRAEPARPVTPLAKQTIPVSPPDPAPEFAADPILAGLNDAQRQAVVHHGPPLIVQAGPGAGKTRTLTHRLAYLVCRRGVDPGKILALTFTRQAAGEMAERIDRLLAGVAGRSQLTIKTFHALGQQILNDCKNPGRGVADEEQRRHLIRECARLRHLPFAALEKQITRWKQTLTYPEDLAAPEPGHQLNLLAPVVGDEDCAFCGHKAEPQFVGAFAAYEDALNRENLWDYEDLIAKPALLLSRNPAIRESYQTRFRHLLVDEYQDLNEAQYRMFRCLAGPGVEIMVIGDPDQAIYGFRGAKPEYFNRFQEDWPEARLCRFSETYRLPAPILAAASPLMESGSQPLKTRQTGDHPLILIEAATARGEALAIARRIETLVGGLSHYGLENARVRHQGFTEKTGFRDIAVLYRLHALGDELERVLSEAGIPCQQAKEGVGPDWDDIDLAAERVKLLTLHAAKGLEFPYVFIAGCETGLMPWKPEDLDQDLEEEKRLFYVGLTRASRQVFLSRARERLLWGQRRRTDFSPWVQAMPLKVLEGLPLEELHTGKKRQRRLFPENVSPRGKRTR